MMRVILVGDGTVGKTSLLRMYKDKEFTHDYVPTVLDVYYMKVRMNDEMVDLEMHDTTGQEDYAALRKIFYHGVNMFIMCYSCVSLRTLENLESFWDRELTLNAHGAAKVVVGNKEDLEIEFPNLVIDKKRARELLKKIGAKANLKCSAKRENESPGSGNITKVFKTALKYGYYNAFPEKVVSELFSRCIVL